ncbi:Rhomboid protease GlpG [Pedobacter sp. Bi27]|jgi:membrane associated rhomboid family serine protease|uniref:rhomboid family intramembrane serine protease n=1 Tax=unclassified Pedobacter TaxID=2628915 RepID=UPI001D9BE358|nr:MULTISPECIES: rhomboid family intramembrane serine protease [unclassified Pedobacter]CAH0230139.1 Rhomboid protease GlpG [Pedobacter sp. Bi27]CAH0243354.1 Rhomboid protease GlpG [Pedobacter sp. Bi36]CAH0269113.1 Rhomboid protease GlpG [Pedobacter sp. Bi126]
MNNIYIPPVVKNLLIINVLFFVASYLLTTLHLDDRLAVYYFDSPYFRYWQPITYMFMHGGIAHIFFNMFALYSFGSILESRWGAKKFITFYFITGLGALFLQWAVQAFEVQQIIGQITLFDNWPQHVTSQAQMTTIKGIYGGGMVGASGAIFGLLVAFGMLYPNAELLIMFIPVPVKAKYIIPIYILVELSLGVAQFEGDSIAHYAHLGGALIGFILVKIWKDKNDTFYTLYE